jgi:hypothetical protein
MCIGSNEKSHSETRCSDQFSRGWDPHSFYCSAYVIVASLLSGNLLVYCISVIIVRYFDSRQCFGSVFI